MNVFVIWGLGIAAFLVILAVNKAWERRRRDAFAAYALTHGCRFDAECLELRSTLGPAFPLFDLGRNRTWRYAMRGSRGGTPYAMFEYYYVTGGGRSSQTHYHAIVVWERPEGDGPAFVAAPETWWDRIKQRFGAQDFDFPEDPAFSEAYQLQGPEEAPVRAYFDAARRSYCIGHPGLHVAGSGRFLLWWRPERLPAPEALDAFLAEADGVRGVFLR